jgi:hypothetical protein
MTDLERCDFEMERIAREANPNEPAWYPAMGYADWNAEKCLIIKELNDKCVGDTLFFCGTHGYRVTKAKRHDKKHRCSLDYCETCGNGITGAPFRLIPRKRATGKPKTAGCGALKGKIHADY